MPSITLTEKKLCLLIGPAWSASSEERSRSDNLIKQIILPVFSASNFDTRRSDEITRPGVIDSKLIHFLVESHIVVTDLTGGRPDVFYALGIRHAANKPVIHMIQAGLDNIFDAELIVPIRFGFDQSESQSTRERLQSELIKLLAEGPPNPNPVTKTIAQRKLAYNA